MASAEWKETLEPYVKVIESVKSTTVNPAAGEDLIIGAVIISDAGPSVPTLITSQKEFVKTYAAQDITKPYTDSLNELYDGDNHTLASTMWLNAYRLTGSGGTLLVSRATKANGLVYSKSLEGSTATADFILKDSEMLKSVNKFKFAFDESNLPSNEDSLADISTAANGWGVSIKDIGVFGNRVNDNGPMYDFYVDNLYDLVQKLNETPKFYSPSYTFYSTVACTEGTELNITEENKATEAP
ncbi:MAG: hypothetical protein HUJ56_05655, partial [Erysipelotrichaceae bacterium]|nr:hypothetical protein [Erysipelotrichaceae bacterium]